jgi:lipopolysaccharide exporter
VSTQDSRGLAKRIGSGALWSALNSGVSRVGQFVIAVVVARIVSPRDFGVFVVATTVYAIIVNVSEVGVSAALIRSNEPADEIGPTVTGIACVTSAFLAAGMFLLASPLASALGSSSAANAVRVLSITVLLAGPSATPSALLTREYMQRRIMTADMASFVVGNALLIPLAVSGAGVMALVWSRVAAQTASTIALILLAPKRYWPGFNRQRARGLLKFGLPLAGANIISFAIGNADFAVVGRVLGAEPLGIYNLAYNISSWPVSVFSNILNSVTLPTFGRVHTRPAVLREHVSLAMSSISAVAFPTSALCLALARPLVYAIYGARWGGAVSVLQVLTLFGLIRVVIAMLSDLLTAVGATRRLLLLQVIWLAALVPAMIILVRLRGVVGAGLAHVLVAALVVVPFYLVLVHGATAVTMRSLARASAVPFFASAVAAGAAYGLSRLVGGAWPALLVGGFGGLLVYLALTAVWIRGKLKEVRLLLSSSEAAATEEELAAGVARDLATSEKDTAFTPALVHSLTDPHVLQQVSAVHESGSSPLTHGEA